MRKNILLISLGLCCVLVRAANVPGNVDDDSEQSGDFETDMGQLKAHHLDASIGHSSPESDIVESVSNGHRQRQQTPTNDNQRSSSKGKALSRRADLNDDVNDFVELIPKAEIKAKLEEYYRNDIDIQHIFEYMHGKEFFELRKSVLDNSDVKEILQYLNKNGLNVKSVLRKIDTRLGISKIRSAQMLLDLQQQQQPAQPQQQTQFGSNTTIGGLNGLIDDVLALLPQDEIFILFFEKLDSNPKFGAFVKSIGDASFHRKYLTLWKSKDLHAASAQLKKHKIDIVKIIQIIQGYFILGTF